jgi:hypothetical protein
MKNPLPVVLALLLATPVAVDELGVYPATPVKQI